MYATEVSLLDLSGTVRLPLTGKLWELYGTYDSQGRVRDQQIESEKASIQSAIVSFAEDPSYLDRRNHMIGVSIEETGASGPLFRSGGYETLPAGAPGSPDGLIEIMVPANPVNVSRASLEAELARLVSTLSLPTGITITSIAPTLHNGSMTIEIRGGALTINLQYSVTFAIEPSFDIRDTTMVFDTIRIGEGRLDPPGAALIGGIFGLLDDIRALAIRSIRRGLSDAALATAANSIGVESLPAGLILSMRRVVITPSGVALFPVVGAYGGILNTFIRDLSDGDLLRETSSPAVFVIYGGAKFHIPDPTVMDALELSFDKVRTVPDGALAGVPNIPRDDTLLREISSAPVYVIRGGQKCWIPDPATLERFGGWPDVRVVPDGGLATIPDGPQIPSVQSPECLQIRADITQRRKEIRDLQQAKAGLDPRDSQDRAEITEINAQIYKISAKISALEQQATALGCS